MLPCNIFSNYNTKLLNPSNISFTASRGKHVFQVICLKKGEQVLTAKVGNGPSARNKYPAVAKAILHFRCSDPVSLQLLPLLVRPDEQEEPCPVPLDTNGQVGVKFGFILRDVNKILIILLKYI